MSLDQPTGFVKQQTESRDAFLGGRLIVSQPRHGFRAGLDSVLLGSSVSKDGRSLLDLGAGVGTAALVALAHNPALSACLAEIEPEALALAERNLLENGMRMRADCVLLDITARGGGRVGPAPDSFDSVIANPPFFDRKTGTEPPGLARAGARHMAGEALDLWVRTAAGAAAPGGEAIFIHRVESLSDLLASFSARFGAISVLPLTPRPGAEASRVLVRGIKGSRAPLVLLSPLVLHEATGNGFAPGVEAILRGEARLDW